MQIFKFLIYSTSIAHVSLATSSHDVAASFRFIICSVGEVMPMSPQPFVPSVRDGGNRFRLRLWREGNPFELLTGTPRLFQYPVRSTLTFPLRGRLWAIVRRLCTGMRRTLLLFLFLVLLALLCLFARLLFLAVFYWLSRH